MLLDDGSVVPSFLAVRSGPGLNGYELAMSDSALRVGRVVAVHPPDADSNTNKKFYEYDVKVDAVAAGTHTEVIYPRCQVSNLFAGVADFMRWRPRIGSQSASVDGSPVSTGSRVYLLCVNGNAKQGVIIGGENHAASAKDTGSPFVAEFLGINIDINADGDLNIWHRGKTKADGTLADKDELKSNTFFTMDKTGDIILSTGKDGDNILRLDAQKKAVRIQATKGDVAVVAGEHMKIASKGMLVGDATDATLMGQTYRDSQQRLHTTIMPQFQAVANALQTASVALNAVATAHATPVIGPVVGAPAVATAATAIMVASQALMQVVIALQEFETKGPYLSKKNKSD
jgi:hypothetical protein